MTDKNNSIEVFQTRLLETIAWCNLKIRVGDPIDSLRTPEFCPEPITRNIYVPTAGQKRKLDWKDANLIVKDLDYSGFDTPEKRFAVMDTLAEQRADALRAENAYPDLSHPDFSGGRLIINDFLNSDVCGMSIMQSEGFFDEYDIAPWDTWIGFAKGERTGALICWVPSEFIALVEGGIAVNPVDCISWATEYQQYGYQGGLDASFFEQLKAHGLLL
jgi:hypothetical protein